MSGEKQGEEAIVGEMAEGEEKGTLDVKSFLWHGGSAWDAWFSCASNQVAQVLLTLPYSFSQLGMLSGIALQVLYGILGSWTAYLISVLYIEYRSRKEKENVNFKNHVIQWFEVLDGLLGPYWKAAGLAFNCTFLLFGSVIQLIACASNIYYINDHLDKRTWTYIFGACCATTVFIPSFHNYRIWSFLGLGMTTYTAWYMAIAALLHGQTEGVTHSGPTKLVLYFTGATNILYTFGGHAVTVEIMHAMWKPQKFKYIYLMATLYVFTLTLPSASAVYWAFGDELLEHSNAFALLPKTKFRDAAVILMLIHQFITFGFACTPLYFVWEKVIGMHDTKSICLRALCRLPVVIPIWFLAIIFPFFGPINPARSLSLSFLGFALSQSHMAEEGAQYSSGPDSVGNKRKYDDQTPPPSSTRRPTGFSAPIASSSPPSSYNSVPPPLDDIQIAKQRAQEIAARLFNASAAAPLDAKRSRVDNGGGYDSSDNGKGFTSAPPEMKPMISNSAPPSMPMSYGGGFQGSSKKIDIPNGRVGVIIGKGGETIKYLQVQSGAKIQVTRDADSDPNSITRAVELMGNPEQISKAETLIREVLAEAESGASSAAPKRFGGHAGSEQFVMRIPNNKVGLVIGKGGETIKNMQAQTGARIQVIPLHPPPGDTSNERTVQIEGSSEQIEIAKQLVNEVISENRPRNSGGYSQQGYQAHPTTWGPPGSQMQQSGYGYAQPGAYPGTTPQYNMTQQPYGGYPTQAGGWDQSNAQSGQQTTPGGGYDYYGQQAPAQQQQQATGASAADNTGYNYNQAPASGYNQQGQGYQQDGYGGYQAPQSGYAGYDQQQQGYNSAPSYGAQEGQTAAYGAQGGDAAQAPTPAQSAPQGYSTGQQPSPGAATYPPQAGYGVAPAAAGSQAGYYGAQKPTPAAYGQAQQSPSNPGGYAQPGYPQSQPPPAAYSQPEAGSQQRAPAPTYGSQAGYGAPAAYGAAAAYNPYGGYSQQQPPAAYPAAADSNTAAAPASQVAQLPKASPQS